MQPDRRRKPRVLVVDDKVANHLALAAVLEDASSGAEALKLLQAQPSGDVVAYGAREGVASRCQCPES